MSNNQKTILITGGAGYIGSHIALLFAQRNFNIIILDNLSQGQDWQHSWAKLIVGDCADTHLVSSIFSTYPIDVVIHCAASIEVSESVIQPINYYLNNVAATLNILQLMVHYDIKKIIFSSSCSVYGIPQQVPIAESHPLSPLSPYAQSKLMVEKILLDCAKAYNLQSIILRYFNAAGSSYENGLGERHKHESHVIPRLLSSALLGTPFTIFGTDYNTIDGTCIRDFVHVLDIAQAHYNAYEYLIREQKSDIFNLGNGQGTSIKQLISLVEQITGTKIKIQYQNRRSGDSPILVADASKAAQLLSWQPKYDLVSQIQSAYAFIKNYNLTHLTSDWTNKNV